MIQLYKNKDFGPDGIRNANLSFDTVFEEIPVVVKNSSLVNALLYEVEALSKPEDSFDKLDLGSTAFMEKNLEMMIECIEELSNEQQKYQYYLRNVSRALQQQNQYIQRKKLEAAQKGETYEPDEEELANNPQFKAPTPPLRMESLLIASQINNYCKQISQVSGQSFAKLFLAERLQK
eukprot:Colp12_sorted_trinity150504_noHs@17861